jgi:glycine/D-amino acid oxidase-like deaminating enzyme
VLLGRWRSIAFAGKYIQAILYQLHSSLTHQRDAFTTSSDFIISPHAGAKGLYVATCGSFHGYKFFPVLGKYVIQMLEDDLTPELKEKWAWDRERPAPSLNPDWPRWEMNDLLDQWPKAKL